MTQRTAQILTDISAGKCFKGCFYGKYLFLFANDSRDNEKPQRKATVGAFQAKARPITNQEVRQQYDI